MSARSKPRKAPTGTATMATRYLTTQMLIERLHSKYPAREYCFLTQVPSNTGGPADRTADALALALWPSRGLSLTGFEVKRDRGDWLRELRNPQKAERIAQYCDLWFLVANHDAVPLDQVPEKWGLMTPNAAGDLVIRKPAVRLDAVPLTREFVAGLLRNVGDSMVPRAACEVQLAASREEGIKEGERRVGDITELERLRVVEEKVLAFERASGLSLSRGFEGLDAKSIGEGVKVLLGGAKRLEWRLNAIDLAAGEASEAASLLRQQSKRLRDAWLAAQASNAEGA